MTEQQRLDNYIGEVLTERFGCTHGITTEAKEWFNGFKEGYRFGRTYMLPAPLAAPATDSLAAPVAVGVAAWVPVAERLPEMLEGIWSALVLVAQENGNVAIAQLMSGGWFLPHSGHKVPETNIVVSWQQLPTAPAHAPLS